MGGINSGSSGKKSGKLRDIWIGLLEADAVENILMRKAGNLTDEDLEVVNYAFDITRLPQFTSILLIRKVYGIPIKADIILQESEMGSIK